MTLDLNTKIIITENVSGETSTFTKEGNEYRPIQLLQQLVDDGVFYGSEDQIRFVTVVQRSFGCNPVATRTKVKVTKTAAVPAVDDTVVKVAGVVKGSVAAYDRSAYDPSGDFQLVVTSPGRSVGDSTTLSAKVKGSFGPAYESIIAKVVKESGIKVPDGSTITAFYEGAQDYILKNASVETVSTPGTPAKSKVSVRY